jgi:hypothetical protein
MPVIPATWEAEMERIMVRGWPWANGSGKPYLQNNNKIIIIIII